MSEQPAPNAAAAAAALVTARQSEALENTTTEGVKGQKRKFGCSNSSSDLKPQDEVYNQRTSDGSLKEFDQHSVLENDDDDEVANSSEIKGKPLYDVEANALGKLTRNPVYMLIPTSCTAKICPAEDVGAGCHKYQVGITDIAGVYALAKEQAKHIFSDPIDQVKWAIIRLEAFIAGWYDRQKYCLRVEAPKESIRTLSGDKDHIVKYASYAWALCAFIPYFIEFNLRTTGANFTSQTLTEYTQKAEKFARSAQLAVTLDYMKAEVLFGDAFLWVGVKRPMEVLKSENPHIPNVFLVRKLAAPAGQAMITSANAVIDSLKIAKWWDPIKVRCGYDQDDVIKTLATNIYKDPWKYHQLASNYGFGELTQAEMDSVNTARDLVIRMAPVLQAYIDTVLKNSDLGKVKVLNKHALNNSQLYMKMKQMFGSILRRKPRTLAEAFATDEALLDTLLLYMP